MSRPNLILCKASAGSGKTFKLAKTYLQILLGFEHEQYCSYDRILAVTFTNKATEEMKSRILKFLTGISHYDKENPTSQGKDIQIIVEDLLNENPSWNIDALILKAKIALSKILHDYSQFSIMTIDKFFNKIVKAFLFELKLHNTSKVSMDTDEALQESISNTLSQYTHDKNHLLSSWLKEMAEEKLDDGKAWQPEVALQKIAKELFKEEFTKRNLEYPIEKVDILNKKLRASQKKFEQEIQAQAQKIYDIIEANGFEEGIFSRNYFPNQTKRLAEGKSLDFYSKSVLESIETELGPFTKGVQKSGQWAHVQHVWQNEIKHLAIELVQYYDENILIYNTDDGYMAHLKSLALLSMISTQMKDYREKKGLMLISDNNTLINKVVDKTDTPFFYEKIGNKYRYILLDEFQDTSQLQWANFLPLISEILSHHQEDSQVLIVGDAKQAIYRWRGGDAQLIQDQVQKDLHQYWDSERSLETLTSNYRSYKDIVEFNNEIFLKMPQMMQEYLERDYELTEGLSSYYNSIPNLYDVEAQQKVENQQEGFVEIKFFEQEGNKAELREEVREKVQQYVLQTITRLVQEKEYAQKDIAILVRTNTEAVDIADFLKENDWSVMTSEALLFNQHRVVRLLISALQLLLNPEDELMRSAVLHQYARVHQLPESDSILEASQREQFFDTYLKQLTKEYTEEYFKALSIYEIVQELMNTLQLHELRDIYTEQFLDVIIEYQADAYYTSLADFLEWWDKKDRSVTISEDNDAIQVTTIHKSKGLEYKVVILPYLRWDNVETSAWKQPILWTPVTHPAKYEDFKYLPINFSKTKDSLHQKEYQDEVILQAIDSLNVAYVAFTRAEEKLYIAADFLPTKKEGVKSNTLSGLLYNTVTSHWSERLQDGDTVQFGQENSKIKASEKSTPNHVISTALNQPISESTYQLSPLRRQNLEGIIGDMIHDILSDYRLDADMDAILQKYSYKYILSPENQKQVFQRVKAFFAHPAIQKLYRPDTQILTEKSLWYEGELLRFDLLILQGKDGELYDFKTGQSWRKKPDVIAKMMQYKKALQEMGYHITKAEFISMDESGQPTFESAESL